MGPIGHKICFLGLKLASIVVIVSLVLVSVFIAST